MSIPNGKRLQLEVQAMIKAGDKAAIVARCNLDPAFKRCYDTFVSAPVRVKTSSLIGPAAEAARIKGNWKRF